MNLIKDPLGYFRADPLPSDAELKELYDGFYSKEKPDYITNQERDLRWWNAMYDDRITVMSEIYHKTSNKIFPLMLDIGCGAGFFLRRAWDNPATRWIGVGIEPNKQALDYAKEKTSCGVFYETSLDNVKETKFCGVHISEVLEHLPRPLETLKEAYDRLIPGGAICVVVPNEKFVWSTDMVEYRLKYPHVFQPPQHLNYFDFESIEKLMKLAGFEIYERSAMYPMESFISGGLDYVKNPDLGILAHQWRKNFDFAMTSEERRRFYKNLASEGLGREAVIYGVKR